MQLKLIRHSFTARYTFDCDESSSVEFQLDGSMYLDKERRGTQHPVIERRLPRFAHSVYEIRTEQTNGLSLSSFSTSRDLRVNAGRERTRWADWPRVLLEEKHLLFQRDLKTKKKNQQKKVAVKGVSSSVLPQPRRDEMLQRADSGPSRNNSRKCQVSVSEMRSAEVSGAFCGPCASLSEPPDRLRMHSGRMRTRSRDTIGKPPLCVHIPCILLGVCYA